MLWCRPDGRITSSGNYRPIVYATSTGLSLCTIASKIKTTTKGTQPQNAKDIKETNGSRFFNIIPYLSESYLAANDGGQPSMDTYHPDRAREADVEKEYLLWLYSWFLIIISTTRYWLKLWRRSHLKNKPFYRLIEDHSNSDNALRISPHSCRNVWFPSDKSYFVYFTSEYSVYS